LKDLAGWLGIDCPSACCSSTYNHQKFLDRSDQLCVHHSC
jgi:hypothetical protein